MGGIARSIFKLLPGRPTRRPLGRAMLLALSAAVLVPAGAAPLHARPDVTQSADGALRTELAKRVGTDLREFYAARAYRPLWIDTTGRVSPAGETLLHQTETAQLDGLKPRKLKPGSLERALERARGGSLADLAKAEVTLSRTYVAYVQALRAAPRSPMIYESQALSPVVPTADAALHALAAAPSLDRYVATMGWMHPLYAPLREALGDARYGAGQRSQIALNLLRVRAIPANPARRYVLIDTNTARLWMYEDGHPIDSMRVVVGKPEQATQTPTMAGFIRFAIVNPYWNVPADLVRTRIAANVLSRGTGYLKHGGYEVLSDWSAHPTVVDPRRIDWHAVAAGTRGAPPERQGPGRGSVMGLV
jgi:murein L,D-transpeptidase YcbB/YkuD